MSTVRSTCIEKLFTSRSGSVRVSSVLVRVRAVRISGGNGVLNSGGSVVFLGRIGSGGGVEFLGRIGSGVRGGIAIAVISGEGSRVTVAREGVGRDYFEVLCLLGIFSESQGNDGQDNNALESRKTLHPNSV